MGLDTRSPSTPARQTSRPQPSNGENFEGDQFGKRNPLVNSPRRLRKDANLRRNAQPWAAMRGNQATPDPDPDPDSAKEESVDEESPAERIYRLRLALFEEVERGEVNWSSETSESRVRNLLYFPDGEPDTLLHQMVDYLRQLKMTGNSKAKEVGNAEINGTRELEKLAAFALSLKPCLLKEPALRTKLTPLQCAIERNEGFAKHLCEVATSLRADGSQMNACQEAIHAKNEGQTCLHFAISRKLGICRFLVEKASNNTLLEGSEPDSNTPLHEAVDFKHLGQRKWWPSLVELIVKKERSTILKLNKNEHSPYRHHLTTMSEQNWSNGRIAVGDVNGVNDKTTNEKEEANSDSEISNAKDEVDLKANGNTTKAKKSSVDEAEKQKQSIFIQNLLRRECLQHGGHKEAFTGLWGSFAGNPRTWLNLLDVELSTCFKEKLNFMKLEPELGFVGVKVPAQKSPFEGREEPIDQHLIVQFFTWLREKKNVREILKVVVRDDRNSPCSDEVIEESLREFNVRYLDWDREDLSSKVIEDTMEDVRGLSLYWSGNDAVLRGWADELTLQDGFRNGLLSLDQLRQVHLIVQQKWDSRVRTEENIDDFRRVLLMEGIKLTGAKFPVRPEGNGGQGGIPKPPKSNQTKTNIWFDKIGTFTEGIGEASIESPQMSFVTVAIIDDGVDPYGPYDIEDTTSFSQPQNPYNGPPEAFPSTLGHGTTMAKIIHKVCPSAKLYIAKLNETVGRRRFTMKYAAKAIQWAVDNDVHIISMSWTIDNASEDDITALETAVGNAKKKHIIMFCAARDQGKEDIAGRTVYPYDAAPDVIIRIGATDQYGKELPYVPDQVDYFLPGVALIDQPVVLANVNKEERNSGEGSSEATALAAGVAALVLFCFGSLYGAAGIDDVKGPAPIKKLFDEFSRDMSRFIHPGLFQQAAINAEEDKNLFGNGEIERRMKHLITLCRPFLDIQKNAKLRNGVH